MLARSFPKTAFLLLLLLISVTPPGFALELQGNWTYRQTGGDNQETQSEFQQRYTLGVGPAVSFQPTDAITVTGGIGYRNTQRSNETGMDSVEQITPFGQVTLVNDIFDATLSANSYTTIAGSENSYSYWNATLNSAWDMPLWPNLSLNYGEDYQGVAKSTMFDDSNGKNTNTTVRVDWDLLLADLYYEYSYNEALNGDADTLGDSTSHYVQFNTGGQLWDGRVGYSLNQQFRQLESQFYVTDAGAGEDQFQLAPIPGGVNRFATTASEDPPEFEIPDTDVTLDSFPASAQVDVDDRGLFSIETGPVRQFDVLYLNVSSSLTPAQQAVAWSLYVRGPSDTSWVLSKGVPSVYDAGENRFELEVNISAREIMVVMNNPPSALDPMVFTGLQAFAYVTADTTSEIISYKTDLSASWRITSTLMTSATFGYEHSESKTGGNIDDEYDKTSWGGHLQWTPSPYVTPSLGYSEYRQQQTGQVDDLNRLYSLVVSTRPLPALSVSFGYTRNDRYADAEKVYSSDSYNLFAKALFYPNLSSSWNVSYTQSQALLNETSNTENEFVAVDNLTSRLDVTADLTRNLTANVLANYNASDSELDGKRSAADTTFSLNYYPSDLLSLRAGYTSFFLDDERTDALRASIEVYLLRTYKSRLTLFATHIQADETIDNFRMIGSWDISRHFTLSTTGAYSMGTTDNYSGYVSLSFRL